MKDRRRFVRWRVDSQGQVKLENAHNFAGCVINDINFKGLRFSLKLNLPRDRYVKLNLVLSEDLCLDIEAWVVWHKTINGFNSYGVYFAKIKDSDKEKIYKFVRKNFPEQINEHWWQETMKEGGEIMQEQNFEDRRIFERFGARIPLRFFNLRENKEGEASTEDISAKGIGFVSREELQPRTPVEVWLQIPDKGEPLYARGDVVWSKKLEPDKHRIGINLERADLMGLSRVLRVT